MRCPACNSYRCSPPFFSSSVTSARTASENQPAKVGASAGGEGTPPRGVYFATEVDECGLEEPAIRFALRVGRADPQRDGTKGEKHQPRQGPLGRRFAARSAAPIHQCTANGPDREGNGCQTANPAARRLPDRTTFPPPYSQSGCAGVTPECPGTLDALELLAKARRPRPAPRHHRLIPPSPQPSRHGRAATPATTLHACRKDTVVADYDGTDGRTHRGRYCAPTNREEAERIAEEVRASGQRNLELVAARTDTAEAP